MQKIINQQQSLFPEVTSRFPSTRYQGSKSKLVDWIWEQIADIDFSTCLDAFGGTGTVAYKLKQIGKHVTYNDLLRFNYYFGKALVENSSIHLNPNETDWLLQRHSDITYPSFVQENFHDIYFTDEENNWIDQTIANIRQLSDPYKFSLAFFALCQACIIKRPYNLFHRKNLYIRFAEVERSFGNKVTWDKPFEEWIRILMREGNQAVLENGHVNHALNSNAIMSIKQHNTKNKPSLGIGGLLENSNQIEKEFALSISHNNYFASIVHAHLTVTNVFLIVGISDQNYLNSFLFEHMVMIYISFYNAWYIFKHGKRFTVREYSYLDAL